MLNRLFAALLIATLFFSELPGDAQQTATAPPATAAPSTVVVPAGTVIPLTLLTAIPGRIRSAGQAIRAQVAFPIIVGDHVVIPANTFVDGTLDYVTPPTTKQKHPDTVIHFKTLTFANGYTVALPTNDISQLTFPTPTPAPLPAPQYPQLALARSHGPSADFNPTLDPAPAPTPEPQFPLPTPPAPTLPAPSSHFHGGIIAGAVGLFAVLVVGAILLSRHVNNSSSNGPSHAAGWQFQLTLQAPLTLDLAKATAPANAN
jgi:hypothetical protein